MGVRGTIHAAFHEPESRVYRVVQPVIWALILVSIAMLIAEPLLPDAPRIKQSLRAADRVLLAVFALEYVLRVLSFRPRAFQVFRDGPLVRARTHVLARLRYAMHPMLLIDLMAVLAVFPEMRGLRALRLLRLLRTLKLFRYANPFASIFHAFEENSLLFIFGFTVLLSEMLIGGLSIYLVEGGANPAVSSVLDGMWWSLVTITTVGFGDITPVTTLGRVIGGVLMVAGMITLALFAGFVGSSLVHAMLSIREEQFRMGDYVNHIVVCGYDPTTKLLLEEFGREFNIENTRVVVFEECERPRDVPTDFLWVQGDPTKQSELDKVRLAHARAVVVVGSRSMAPQAADARTILTTFTIRAYLRSNDEEVQGRRQPLYIVVEILDSENVDHARTAGADEVIETRRVAFSMLAHTVRYHGTADTMSRVLMSGEHNAYVGVIPDPPDEAITFGELLARMRLNDRGGVVIGLRSPDGNQVFSPSKEFSVTPGSLVVYLAEKPILDAPP